MLKGVKPLILLKPLIILLKPLIIILLKPLIIILLKPLIILIIYYDNIGRWLLLYTIG